MHPRTGLGLVEVPPFDTNALINQGIAAGVKWASQTDAIQKLNQMAGTAIQGATVGAAIGTAIFPGIGTAIGTVAGVLISFVGTLLQGIGAHSCTLTILDGNPIPCSLYGRNVVSAIDWLRTHPIDAITMHPSSLSQQFNIAPGNEIRNVVDGLIRASGGHIAGNVDDTRALLDAAKMPSASDLLRIAQIPAASAWVAAQPQKIPTAIFTLTDTFPALTIQDTNQIFLRAQPVYAAFVKSGGDKTHALSPNLQGKEASTTRKVVTGVALTAAAATIGTWVYARVTHRTFRQVVKSWVPSAMRGHRRNPLPSALGSTTAGRTLAYRVQLGFPGGDAITFNPDGTATYTQQQRSVAVFRPTTYQLAKIRTGRGEVLIFTDQILRNLLAP